MRAEPIAAVHDGHRRGAWQQLDAPIERTVAPADDHDPLSAKGVGIRHDVEDAAAIPGLRARLRQSPWREGPDPGRDDQCPRGEPAVFSDEHEVIAVLL